MEKFLLFSEAHGFFSVLLLSVVLNLILLVILILNTNRRMEITSPAAGRVLKIADWVFGLVVTVLGVGLFGLSQDNIFILSIGLSVACLPAYFFADFLATYVFRGHYPLVLCGGAFAVILMVMKAEFLLWAGAIIFLLMICEYIYVASGLECFVRSLKKNCFKSARIIIM